MFSVVALWIYQDWPVVIGLGVLAIIIKKYFNHGLNQYPGPFLANFTDWWRFFDACGTPHVNIVNLHRQHGDIVRLGPNCLSFASPAALKTIYGLNKGMVKSEFYPVQQGFSNGKRLPSLFSTTDEKYHAELRRCVNGAFAMSTLVNYEPQVNDVVEFFLNRTDDLFVKKSKTCDFAEWLQFFAFDVIGQITYSKRHGFLDNGEDIDGMVKYLARIFRYAGPVGQQPWLDKLLLKNPLVLLLDRLGFKPFAFPVATFAKNRMAERLADEPTLKEKPGQRADLLSMFLRAKVAHPNIMTDQRVLTMAISMAFAGSETTGISLSTIFYQLLKNRACYIKLQNEIDEAVRSGRITNRPSGVVSWAESQELPYLAAVVKESFRMHPAPALLLERVTSPSGIEIEGHFIPGRTIVGCNAWVIHRRSEIFGGRVDEFIPERWMEASPTRLKEMNSNLFQFSAGPRTCIGKNIALLEIYKTVPAFLRRFEVKFENGSKDWRLTAGMFIKQHDFHTTFERRRMPFEDEGMVQA